MMTTTQVAPQSLPGRAPGRGHAQQGTTRGAHSRRLPRSIAAVLSGLAAIVTLSLGTDQVLHVLEVYPPWGQPMYDAGLNLLALGIVGFALSAAGAIATITQYDLGPDWYPIALALTAVPCAWLGGALHRARNA